MRNRSKGGLWKENYGPEQAPLPRDCGAIQAPAGKRLSRDCALTATGNLRNVRNILLRWLKVVSCRMVERGIAADAIQPQFCDQEDAGCF